MMLAINVLKCSGKAVKVCKSKWPRLYNRCPSEEMQLESMTRYICDILVRKHTRDIGGANAKKSAWYRCHLSVSLATQVYGLMSHIPHNAVLHVYYIDKIRRGR